MVLTYKGDHRSGFGHTALQPISNRSETKYFFAVEAWLVEEDGVVKTKVRWEQI